MIRQRNSFQELSARERVKSLLDAGTFRELLGPFDGFESPHLPAQGIVPQGDDGAVTGRGLLGGVPALVVATEGAFQGGGIGEVSGAKIAGALELALRENRAGRVVRPVVVFDTGGVRLQEANYGLLAIAEIQAAVSALRELVPVVGVIPGKVGCFGGMSITAGLFSALIVTKGARLTLNGPEVIEQEAGVAELDSEDKARIWATIGGTQRAETGFADILAEDDAGEIAAAVRGVFARGVFARGVRTHSTGQARCERVRYYTEKLLRADPNRAAGPETARALFGGGGGLPGEDTVAPPAAPEEDAAPGRGSLWFEKLTAPAESLRAAPSSVLCADTVFAGRPARVLCVVPDPRGRFPRARRGEAGLEEGWALAARVREAVEADAGKQPRAILAVVDVPSQAYGYKEELFGLHQALAAAVDAYACARRAGHPVVACIVGNAISGAFLAHGLQSGRIVAFDDPGVAVHAMSKQSAARITKRSVGELDSAADQVPGIAYDIRSFDSLGAVDVLLGGIDADHPSPGDVERVRAVLVEQIALAVRPDLGNRLESEKAKTGRRMSVKVREELERQWNTQRTIF